MTITFLIVIIALVGFCNCSHVRVGIDQQTGEYNAEDGSGHTFAAFSSIKQPIVCWADLVADDLSVTKCSNSFMVINGDYDEEDFKIGNVLTFLKTEYAGLGCPPSPFKDEVSMKDQVVFRRITKVTKITDGIRIRTTHEHGYDVIPDVYVQIDAPEENIPVTRRMLETGMSPKSIKNVTRDTELGDIDDLPPFEDTRTFKYGSASVKVSYKVRFDGGVFDFHLSRTSTGGKAVFELDMYAKTELTLTLSIAAPIPAEYSLFEKPIPNLGFDISLRGFGELEGGIYVGAKAIADLSLTGMTTTFHLKSGVSRQQDVEVSFGVGGYGVNVPYDSSYYFRRLFRKNVTFTDMSVGVGRSVSAFAGLRPYLGVGFKKLPLIGECDAELLMSIGLQFTGQLSTAGFPAVTTGSTVGPCDQCHFLEGGLSWKGKNLDLNATLGSQNRTFTIKEEFLNHKFATGCGGAKNSC